MPQGYTYFCTDHEGRVYLRHSRGHLQPQYRVATIRRKAGEVATKGQVSYTATNRATEGPNEYEQVNRFGQYETWTWEVVKVRAYPGKHQREPKPGFVSVEV